MLKSENDNLQIQSTHYRPLLRRNLTVVKEVCHSVYTMYSLFFLIFPRLSQRYLKCKVDVRAVTLLMSCGLSHRPQTWFSLCSCGSTVRLCRTVYVEDMGLESWVSEGRYLLHKGARLSSEGSLCTMLWTLTTLVCVGERERERERESVWVCVCLGGQLVNEWVS